jgi:hypothetical protein
MAKLILVDLYNLALQAEVDIRTARNMYTIESAFRGHIIDSLEGFHLLKKSSIACHENSFLLVSISIVAPISNGARSGLYHRQGVW